MKNINTLGLIILISGISFLSVSLIDRGADPKQLFEEAQAKIKSFKAFEIAYQCNVENPNLDEPISASGIVKIKGIKYKNSNRSNITTYVNGQFYWILNMEEEEISKENYEAEEHRLTTIDFSNLDFPEEPTYKYNSFDGNNHKISLFFKSTNSDYWKCDLLINMTTNLITRSIFFARNGTTETSILKYQNVDIDIPDSVFELDVSKYPDFYVNDMTE